MELYSFNKIKMWDEYNRILNLYYNANNVDDKIKLYNQLLVLSEYLENYSSIKYLEPKELKSYIKDKKNKQIEEFKALNELTSELGYFWCDSLRDFNYNSISLLSKKILTKEEFFREINLFFEDVVPSDKELIQKTFEEQRIEIKKTLFLSREEISFLEVLNGYYIKILYHKNLNKIKVKNTIHEFGHASEFLKTCNAQSKDYLMQEVIATLYEMLYIDFCFPNDINSRVIELSNIFKTVRPILLEASLYQGKSNKLNQLLIYEIWCMYTYVIAATVYLKKSDSNFKEIVEYIKLNTPYLNTFKILENINITKDDLIYTSKNIKKLLLERG